MTSRNDLRSIRPFICKDDPDLFPNDPDHRAFCRNYFDEMLAASEENKPLATALKAWRSSGSTAQLQAVFRIYAPDFMQASPEALSHFNAYAAFDSAIMHYRDSLEVF